MLKSKKYIFIKNKNLFLCLGLNFLLFAHCVFAQSNCDVDDPNLKGRYRGECKDDEAHGKGTAKGKYTYSGYFKYGKKDSKGKYIAPGYFSYKGTFKNDLYSGFGQLEVKGIYVYKGSWKEGMKYGKGTCYWKNKAKYDGQWAADEREGYGTYTHGKMSYQGEWKADKCHGKGKYTYEDKSVYEGSWENGKRSGYGTFTKPKGFTYKGQWKDGKRDGDGVQTHIIKKGNRLIERKYTGRWKNNYYEGRGKLTFSGIRREPKFTYDGQWIAGLKSGFGTYTWAGGQKYTGEWKDDKRNGKGEYTFASGTRYVGEWKNNQMTGEGVRYYEGGKITKAGTWLNGNIQKEKSLDEVLAYLDQNYKPIDNSDDNFAPPSLVIEEITFVDSYKNAQTYNNNQLDYNEEAEIVFFLKNNGQGKAKDIGISVKEKNYVSGIRFTEKLKIGDIDAGLRREVSIPIAGSEALEDGKADFVIRVSEGRGFDVSTTVKVSTKGFIAPALRVSNHQFTTQTNTIALGTEVTLEVQLENVGQGFAEDVKVSFQLPADVFPTNKTEFELRDIEAGKSQLVNFSFVPNNRYKAKEVLIECLVLEKSQQYGIKTTFRLNIDKLLTEKIFDFTTTRNNGTNFNVADVDVNLPKTNNSRPDAFAVVIGNRDYEQTQNVDYAINDARSIKRYLIDVMGFKEGNILYYENASKSDFQTLFGGENDYKGKLFNSVKPKKSDVFLFYAGHGAPSLKNGKNYFVPVESDPNYISLNGYSIELFNKNLAQLPAKSIAVVLDACFSGANVFSGVSGFKTVPRKSSNLTNGVLLSSSTGDQVSSWYDEKKHGLFTYFFLKAIHNKNADYDKDDKLSFREIFEFIADKSSGVPYHARSLHGIEQNPTIEGKNIEATFLEY